MTVFQGAKGAEKPEKKPAKKPAKGKKTKE